MRNSLSLPQQLSVVEWLKRNGPFLEETYGDIAKRCEKELELPLTNANIRGIMKAIGMEVVKKIEEDEILKTLTMALYGLYRMTPGLPIPDGLRKLAKRYHLND